MNVTEAMRRAIELARKAPDPRPNPRVGCVLLDPSGDQIATGAHDGPGTPHAEAIALTVAGERARGATAVVTMEPCTHTGRTGPCTKALIDAGVAKVVFAQEDPNPVAAGGAAALRAAGLHVDGGLLAEPAEELNPVWTFAMRHQRPRIVWKVAATLDGRVAAPDGSSRWITGAEARAEVHTLRAEVDGILVGTNTVLVDDPELVPRGADGKRAPMRIVMGQRSVPAGARIRHAEPMRNFWQIPTRDTRFALAQMFRRELHLVLLEGGPSLAAAFLRAGVVDEIRWYVAPAVLGDGPSAVGDLGIGTMAGIQRFRMLGAARVGDDVRIDLRPS